MFNVGDIITGTPENDYRITTRGMVCRVIDTNRFDPGYVAVKIINIDEDLIKESISSYVRHIANLTNLTRHIGNTHVVAEKYFEHYEPKAKLEGLLDDLIDFVDSV